MTMTAPAATHAKSNGAARPLYADQKSIPSRRAVKAARMPSKNRSRVVQDLSLWAQAGRLGGKLTPGDVSNIIRQADSGYITKLMDLANECRQKDCHLQAVLAVAEESIAGLDWKIATAENARAKDKRAAKWVEEVLRAIPNLRRLISYLAGAPYYGFDVNEIVWRREGSRLVPDDFAHLSHRRFGFDPKTGKFVLRDDGMPPEGVDFREKWPNKFIVSQPRSNGDAPQREGLCKPLIWMTQFRVWTFADWLRTAELSWKPWRIGTYKKGVASTEDEDALEMILERLSTTGWASKPDSMTIDIEWPDGSQTTKATHSELCNVLANEMSKCVLGQTETVQASSSSGYAQAKVHDSVRKDLLKARAEQVAADITRDLIGPMIAMNFNGVAVPRFEFITQDPVDLKSFAEGVEKLAKSELRIPAKWVRDQAGIPEPKKDEECIGGPKVDPAAGGEKPGDDTKPGDASDDEEPAPPVDSSADDEEPATEDEE